MVTCYNSFSNINVIYQCSLFILGNSSRDITRKDADASTTGENIHIDQCLKSRCSNGKCWCCWNSPIPGETFCWIDYQTCMDFCPPFPPKGPNP